MFKPQPEIGRYFRSDCLDTINASVKDLPTINKRIDNLKNETKELKKQINENAPSYAQMIADTTNLKRQVEELNTEVTAQKTMCKNQPPSGDRPTIEPIETKTIFKCTDLWSKRKQQSK
ncbi:unnamed protein product [Ceutorhynchus assimilis]|uniref:Uncharacterized protein n=1 Tax=Ceutorhynchus assimilis TaxID=467358 RepID=A0A9N9MI91_9CUCU|nr:unnamed protein product [Ceutorhynchus assimilis]